MFRPGLSMWNAVRMGKIFIPISKKSFEYFHLVSIKIQPDYYATN